jgi:hypothetical protein
MYEAFGCRPMWLAVKVEAGNGPLHDMFPAARPSGSSK